MQVIYLSNLFSKTGLSFQVLKSSSHNCVKIATPGQNLKSVSDFVYVLTYGPKEY